MTALFYKKSGENLKKIPNELEKSANPE